MAVTTTNIFSGPFNPNGVTSVFPFTFKAVSADEVTVKRADGSGNETIVDPALYTVGIDDEEGGTVTFAIAPAAGDPITIHSDPSFLQQAVFSNHAAYLPAVLNEALDRSAIRDQALKALGEEAKAEALAAAARAEELLGLARGPKGDPGSAGGNIVSSRTALAARTAAAGDNYQLTEGVPALRGRYGSFVWNNANLSALVAVDPRQGLVVPPASSPSGAAGAWVRILRGNVIDPFMFGAVGDGVTDDSAAIQAAMDFATIGGDAYALDLSGTFGILTGLVLGDLVTTRFLRDIRGTVFLKALGPIDKMLTIGQLDQPRWSGGAYFFGTGGPDIATRSCKVGLHNWGGSRMTVSGGLRFYNFLYAGYTNEDGRNLSGCVFGGVMKMRYCGSGNNVAAQSYQASFTGFTNNGAAGSTTQTCTLTGVTNFPPQWLYDQYGANIFVRINGLVHKINGFDAVAGTVTVTRQIPSTTPTGTLTYIWGAGYLPIGNDANCNKVAQIDAQTCGVGIYERGLYPSRIDLALVQDNGVGIMLGDGSAVSCIGADYSGIYCESNQENFILVTRIVNSVWGTIKFAYEVDLSLVYAIGAPRESDDSYDAGFSTFKNFTIWYQGKPYSHQKNGRNDAFGTSTLSWSPHQLRNAVEVSNSCAVSLSIDDNLNRLLGYDSGKLTLIGTAANGAPTGTITFNPPSGKTVNGGASAAFAGFNGPATFSIYYRYSANDWIVKLLGAPLTASATYNPPSLAAGIVDAAQTITVTGAALGDEAKATFSADLQGVELAAWVSAANSVKYQFRNPSGGATVDLASGTVKAVVRKA
jgi:hypothetical protein